MKKSLIATLPVAAFVAGMAVGPSVFAADSQDVADFASLQACIDKVVDGDVTCKLTQNITVENGTKLRLGKVQQTGMTTPHTVTIDLGTNTISGPGKNKVLIGVADANMVITGNGTIEYTGEETSNIAISVYGGATATDGSQLTIDSGVKLVNGGIGVVPYSAGSTPKDNYGTVVNFNGSINSTKQGNAGIYINGTIQNTKAMPKINIGDTASISVPSGMGIYQAGNADTTIGTATITGDTGIGIKAGTLVLNGTNVHATGAAGATDLETDGIEGTGSALQVESNDPPYAGQVDVVINAGTSLVSDNNFAIEAYGAEESTEGIKKIEVASPDVHLVSAEGKPVVSNTATGFEGVVGSDDELFDFGDGSVWPIPAPAPAPEAPAEEVANPNTADSIALYATIAVLAVLGLGATAVVAKKSNR